MAQNRSLLKNLSAALGGEAIQALLSVAIFFGLFFQLDDADWGRYSAVAATGLIIGTIANLGSQELMVRNVVRNGDLADEWGQTVATQVSGALIGLALGLAVRPIFFPDLHLLTALALLSFNILLLWSVETTVQVGQATSDLSIGTRGRLAYAVGRLSGVGVFALVGTGNINHYAAIATPLAFGGAAVAIRSAIRKTGTTPRPQRPTRERLVRGIPFVGTAGAQDLLASFDRPLLSANGFVVETGQYAIADRIARLASIPTMALVRTTAADFFRSGEHNDRETFRLAIRYARPAVLYGVLASSSIAAGALLMRGHAPERFEPVLPMIAALAALTTLQAIQLFPANVLTGTDRQPARLTLYLGAAGLNAGLNLLWIPEHSWRGAAAATIVAESALAVMLWLVAWRTTRSDSA